METGSDNPYLPQDVIINILKMLPAKSLLRFKSVCKDWRNLIKSSFFIEDNYNYSSHNNPLLICLTERFPYWQLCFHRYEKENNEFEEIPEIVDDLKRVCGFIGSINGLICVKLKFPSSLMLLNPITREVRKIPKPKNNNDDGHEFYGFQWGLGYSPIVKDYKIVSIQGARVNEVGESLGFIHIDQVEVYSLRTYSWKQVEFGITRSSCLHSNPVAFNGAIFWLGSVEDVEGSCGRIISFDVATEIFTSRQLPFPTSVSSIGKIVLDVYENKIALLHQNKTKSITCIDLWVLGEGSDSDGMSFGWTKKYCIRSRIPDLLPKGIWRNEIVCYSRWITVTEGQTEILLNGGDGNLCNQASTVVNKMKKKYHYWLRIGLYVVLVLVGQSSAILLGRLYYQQGGKSKWMGTLVQNVGFPSLLPLYTIPAFKHSTTSKNNIQNNNVKQPCALKLASVYVSLGFLLALECYLYSIGLSTLPVSTYSLIGSSKLAFNALFSFFLNSQKFTPCIINSIVLLTISSILLVFQTGSSSTTATESSTQVSENKYAVGFISTIGAAAGNGLILSLTQLAFNKVLKSKSFKGILDMQVYPSLVASLVTVIGLFGSGEFKGLRGEMEKNEMGNASYVLTLSFIAITWQVYSVGSLSLIMEVTSLFSNSISIVGLPIVPILAVLLFHDTMNGLKVISLMLAIWGFMSYVYQQYLDEPNNSKIQLTRHRNDV